MRLLKTSAFAMAIVMLLGVFASIGAIPFVEEIVASAAPMTWTPAWQRGETPPAWSQAAIDKAATGTSRLIVGTGMHSGGGGFNALDGGDAKGGALELCVYMNTLGLMAWYEPNLKAFVGTKNEITVSQALANQITGVLRADPTGVGTSLNRDHSPAPTGRGGIGEWVDGTVAMAIALARHNPEVWDLLSADTKVRADVIMTSLAISGNHLHNYANTHNVDMSHIYEWNKSWNPNLTEGYVDMMIGVYYYFGGADEVNAIFDGFDVNVHIAKLEQYGYLVIAGYYKKNIDRLTLGGSYTDTVYRNNQPFNVTSTYVPMKGLHFTYRDINNSTRIQYDPIELYKSVAKVMYNRVGVSEFNFVATIDGVQQNVRVGIADMSKSPFDGLLGMANELNSIDGNGLRSDGGYVLDNWKTSIPAAATIKAFGDWKGEGINDIESRMYVGSEDFLFKINPARGGYNGWEKGKKSHFSENSASTDWHGYVCVKDIWQKMLKDDTGYEAGFTRNGATLNVSLKAFNLNLTTAQNITAKLEIYNSAGGLHTTVEKPFTIAAKTQSTSIGSVTYNAWQDGYRARLVIGDREIEIIDKMGALSKEQAVNVLSISNIGLNKDGENYSISADINNTFTSQQSVPFIAAVYDGNGKLVDVQSISQDVAAGYKDALNFGYAPGEPSDDYTIKIMVWKSNMEPYCPAVEKLVSEL